MTNEEMKELYRTGEYVCYWATPDNEHWQNRDKWFKTASPTWVIEYRYKLIHKRHADIAEKVAKNPDTEVESTNVYGDDGEPMLFTTAVSFFKWYNEKYEYRLKPQEAKEDEQRQSRNNNNSNMDLERDRETISITAPDGTVYEFEKPNFNIVMHEVRNRFIFGRVNEMPVVIGIDGRILDSDYVSIGKFLTPIKKEWYEYPENFPALVINSKELYLVNSYKDGWVSFRKYEKDAYNLNLEHYRLATKEEVMSLYWKDK